MVNDSYDILDADGLKGLASDIKALISTYRFEHYKPKLKEDSKQTLLEGNSDFLPKRCKKNIREIAVEILSQWWRQFGFRRTNATSV